MPVIILQGRSVSERQTVRSGDTSAERWPWWIYSLLHLNRRSFGFVEPHNSFIETAVVFTEKFANLHNSFANVGNQPAKAQIAPSLARHFTYEVITGSIFLKIVG